MKMKSAEEIKRKKKSTIKYINICNILQLIINHTYSECQKWEEKRQHELLEKHYF